MGWRGTEPGAGADEYPSNDALSRSEFQLWPVYDAGGPEPRLKVRFCDGLELPDWRAGPDLDAALRQAEAQGWHAFDTEPGNSTGEHCIVHLKRIVAR